MKTSHAGLNISEAEWEIFMVHLVATLDKFQVPEQEKEEFLACAASVKGDIVEKS